MTQDRTIVATIDAEGITAATSNQLRRDIRDALEPVIRRHSSYCTHICVQVDDVSQIIADAEPPPQSDAA